MDYCGMVVTLSNLKTFNLWLKRQGVRLEGVKIALDPYGGAGVFATRDLSARSVLMLIPETAVMSLRNLRCDEVDFLLERDFPPSQVLELAIASELMRGAESPFYGYLQVLPHHPGEDIPLLWDDEHLNSLAGTGLDIAARKRRQRLEGIYTEMMAALASDDAMHSSRFAKVTFEALMVAASLTSSRCMYVDDRHGYALVPAADAMNHKCALAPERGHSAGEDEGEEEGEDVEDDEAEKCNSGMADEHGDSQIDRVPDHRFVGASRRAVREAAQGLGLDLTMEASFANLEKRPFQWDSTDEEEDEEEEDSEEEEEDEEQGPRPVRQCMVVSMCDLPRGAEVHYTYGELGNSKLLGLAGFMLPANPLTICALSFLSIRTAHAQQVGAKAQAAREQALRKVKGWDSLLRRSYTFDLTATPPFELRLLLMLLTAPTLEPFLLKGGKANDKAVDAFRAQPLKRQLSKVAARLLAAAIDINIEGYSLAGATPRPTKPSSKKRKQGEVAVSCSPSPPSASRRERAELLVREEVALWTKARERLRVDFGAK